ncbi:MAG: cupin domain-containing protein [Oscillospiraceae bacterium]|nr:cupin domain-containing protein [Oscillospiraceae bacterium]
MKQIGERIRELRERGDLTQGDMAATLGVPMAAYCQYEDLGVDIPVAVLYQLSVMFKMDMAELLTGQPARMDNLTIVRHGQGKFTARHVDYCFQQLAQDYKGRAFEPMLVTLEPLDKTPDMITRDAQEFNFVLAGKLEFFYDGRQMVLEQGDSVYFDASKPHGHKAIGGTAMFLVVTTDLA